jgi:hypothetical protein
VIDSGSAKKFSVLLSLTLRITGIAWAIESCPVRNSGFKEFRHI